MKVFAISLCLLSDAFGIAYHRVEDNLSVNHRIVKLLQPLAIQEVNVEVHQWWHVFSVLLSTNFGQYYLIRLIP